MKKAEGNDQEIPGTASMETMDNGTTHRGLKPRHSQMIALGGCVGTGLFVGTGATLATGGPAFILAAFIVMSLLVHSVVTTIVEVTAYMPINGASMSYYASRYVSPSLGVAMGWLYVYSLGILVPYEITAGALVIDYWNSPVDIAVWITIFIFVIVGLNFLPVKYYGESEFWFAAIKVITIAGLLILAFVIFWGGGPNQNGILGFHYWKEPGATTTYLIEGSAGTFVAFVQTLVLSAFPFVFAPELLLFTSGEMNNPQKDLPKAGRRFTLRLIVFYIGSALAIGVMCPRDEKALINGGQGAKSSAFVVGIQYAGIHGLGSVVNAVILTTAWSAGSAYLYMSSRALYSLALAGQTPTIFKRCTKEGVPYVAVTACSLFSLLAYLNCGTNSSTVFQWFVNITNTSGFLSWISCCVVYLRFRAAWSTQGKPALPYRSWIQPYGAWFAMFFFIVLAFINGFSVFFPGQFSISNFVTTYIGIPAFFALYLIHKIWRGRSDSWLLPASEIDIHEGLEHIYETERPVSEEEPDHNK
ncbi:amino acid permease/ SLC12A domain-containing protein [Penicillium argentinense]|uniref:Amino acid permease/ SLC12A domain-containing protein n=1 Tax=Penicillium argentinense TaxID=1131581 RepID=A0A9W9K9G0_9EURO|nr:amino acid permease/ SLC12A domain-containing protein [Penicillium argentinense]KAJ5097875.1 amino acid permease/ SLC12A domain-containing protein [Penicillium argentinense]